MSRRCKLRRKIHILLRLVLYTRCRPERLAFSSYLKILRYLPRHGYSNGPRFTWPLKKWESWIVRARGRFWMRFPKIGVSSLGNLHFCRSYDREEFAERIKVKNVKNKIKFIRNNLKIINIQKRARLSCLSSQTSSLWRLPDEVC